MSEISYEEFIEDIRRQKREIREPEPAREPEPEKEPWEAHPEALSKSDYDTLTSYGRTRLKRPRPVWLREKKRWTVGAPANPAEWQILIQSEPTYGRSNKYVTREDAEKPIRRTCGFFRMSKDTFSECVRRLERENLLKTRDGFKHAKIVDKWLHPDLSGQRAGGEWHQNAIRDFVDMVNRKYGCFTYVDRGFYPSVSMPDVIVVRPELVERSTIYGDYKEPIRWKTNNPVYSEFKSKNDMREHLSRLEKQLNQYQNIPLYLEVGDRINRAREMLEDRGRRWVSLLELLGEPEGDMFCLHGSERWWSEKSFYHVIEKIKKAFSETYDAKARLKKTKTDTEGQEYHELVLYDSLDTPKNLGQVIPNFAADVREFAELYFREKYLGRITTADYIYVPERKPTSSNKTWAWKKKKTKGFRFRSFSMRP